MISLNGLKGIAGKAPMQQEDLYHSIDSAMTSNKSTWRNDLNSRDIPKHQKRAPKHKHYGIEQWSAWSKKWCLRQWYVTKKARDQAFETLQSKTTILTGTQWDTAVRKVDR